MQLETKCAVEPCQRAASLGKTRPRPSGPSSLKEQGFAMKAQIRTCPAARADEIRRESSGRHLLKSSESRFLYRPKAPHVVHPLGDKASGPYFTVDSPPRRPNNLKSSPDGWLILSTATHGFQHLPELKGLFSGPGPACDTVNPLPTSS